MKKYDRHDLYRIALFIGFSSAIAQVLLVRELLTIFRGNELIIGIIFAAWFTGVFLGAALNPSARKRNLQKRITFSVIVLPAVLALSLYGAHLFAAFSPRTTGIFSSIGTEMALAFLCTVPVSFFSGFFFPPLVALVAGEARNRSGGIVYFLEAMGAFFGGITFSFVFVEHLNPLEVIAILGAAAIALWIRHDKKLRPLLFIPLILALSAHVAEKKMMGLLWAKNHTGKLIEYRRTRYQTVSLESEGQRYTVYGDGIPLYTFPDPHAARPVFHLIESLRGTRKKILLFGSGPGSILYNLLKENINSLTYFESDPELWRMIEPYRNRAYHIKKPEAKLRVVLKDLRRFLNISTERFDMIVSLPAGPENIMLNRFYTREFYRLCRKHLASGGIMLTSIKGFSNNMSDVHRRYTASNLRSFIEEFPAHMKCYGERIYLVGSEKRSALPAGPDALIASYAQRLRKAPPAHLEEELMAGYSSQELKSFFQKSQIDSFNSVIIPLLEKVQPNSDMRPAGLWGHIMFSTFRESSPIYLLIKEIRFIPPVALFISLIFLLIIAKRFGPSYLKGGALLYITGFTGISAALIFIILYQNTHGVIYYRIALINALYMFGLTAGSYMFNKRQWIQLPLVFLIMALLSGGIALYTLLRIEPLFWILLFLYSFFSGSIFPSFFSAARSKKYINTASVLTSMETFGSILGSFLTIMVLFPLLGLTGNAALIAGLHIAAAGIAVFRK